MPVIHTVILQLTKAKLGDRVLEDRVYVCQGRDPARVRVQVSLHLCYLVYPGTQDCFDTFTEMSGVYGKTAEELAEVDHFSSWVFLGNEWRVEVVDEIETIRVLGPLQAAG